MTPRTIRPLDPDLAPDVALFLEAERHVHAEGGGSAPADDELMAFLNEKLASDAYHILVSDAAAGPVGIVFVDEERAYSPMHVHNLYVVEAHRGQGHGRALMEAVQELASRLGREYVSLRVTLTNQPAVDLYRSLGFEPRRMLLRWTPPES